MQLTIQPFWRSEPFSEREQRLLTEVLEAHHRSCFRENVSTQAVVQTAFGSGRLENAIAGAILTLGGVHAPLAETMDFINESYDKPERTVGIYLSERRRVPGWGNSFIKGGTDDLWKPVDDVLREDWSDYHARLEGVTLALHATGKIIFPNPSAYTAICAIILGIPPGIAAMLFIAGRVVGWTQLVHSNLNQ